MACSYRFPAAGSSPITRRQVMNGCARKISDEVVRQQLARDNSSLRPVSSLFELPAVNRSAYPSFSLSKRAAKEFFFAPDFCLTYYSPGQLSWSDPEGNPSYLALTET
jgi:hypothetical protein